MNVTILSKESCENCVKAEKMTKDLNIPYTKRYVDKNLLKQLCGKPTVSVYPQMLVNDQYVGDIYEYEEYIDEHYEPILLPNPNRFTVFPIRHHNLWDMYKKAQMSNWTAEEIDFSNDMTDWNNLSENEKHFIKHILAFFASSDGIVFENINLNFAKEVQLPEALSFYAYQSHNEMVHGETYSTLIEKYVSDISEKEKLFRAIETVPCVKAKALWAQKWFDSSLPFSHRLIAFACVEGIFFSGSFCAIFWLKKRGLLPGLSFSNELISRDEGLHLEFAVELYSMLRKKVTKETVYSIVTEAVTIEKSFIVDALPCKLIGMDADKMSTYIEFVADRLLKQLGFPPVWNSRNPFDFMENICLDGKTNFFEKRVGDYGKLEGSGDPVSFDEDF